MALLDAIIAEMDPPESYGPKNSAYKKVPETTPRPKPQKSEPKSRFGKGCAIVAIALLAIGLIPIILTLFFFTAHETTPDPIIEQKIIAAPRHEPNPQPAITKLRVPRQSPLVGKWTAIDLVSSISEFHPKRMYNVGGLELKSLEFLPDGKTDKAWWTWKNNRLFHSGDQSEAELMIVTVNQTEYLFMEWMSDDAPVNKEKARYYVLKRGAYIDPSLPKIIQEGVGWNGLRIGATRAELIAEFGPPDSRNSMVMSWSDRDIACHLGGNSALHEAVQLNFGSGFSGTTSKGIHMGSAEEDVLAVYGNPEHISKSASRRIRGSNITTMTWLKLGIQITLNESSEVTQIDIVRPH